MKGIRGLLEKDFRLFRYQGGKFFLVIAIVGLFLSLAGNMGTNFVSIYITSVMAIYSGSTISYDEAEHGYNYLFSLPINRKVYVQEKYIFSFILTVVGWCAGMICAGIAAMIKPGERFNLERLAESLIALMIILAISSITVCLMCPTMSFFATLLFKSAGKEFIAVWFQTTALNFPMAFFWQIFFAGPLVRAIFGMIFKEKEPQVMKEEAEYLEGGEAR